MKLATLLLLFFVTSALLYRARPTRMQPTDHPLVRRRLSGWNWFGIVLHVAIWATFIGMEV
jgi:hypothetical protein